MTMDWNAWNDAYTNRFPKGGVNPALSDLLNEHRFVNPYETRGDGCSCGWRGESWPEHRLELVDKFLAPEDEKPKKKK